jgi:hypothetical protein
MRPAQDFIGAVWRRYTGCVYVVVAGSICDRRLQNLLKLLLLLCRERLGEPDAHADDEVTAFAGFLALRHAEAGEALREVGACGTTAADGNLLPVNGLDGPLPAGKGFLEVELDDVLDVVAFAGEEGMCFLCDISFSVE